MGSLQEGRCRNIVYLTCNLRSNRHVDKEVQLYKGKYGQMSVEDVKNERIYGLKRVEGMKLLEFFFVIFFPI